MTEDSILVHGKFRTKVQPGSEWYDLAGYEGYICKTSKYQSAARPRRPDLPQRERVGEIEAAGEGRQRRLGELLDYRG